MLAVVRVVDNPPGFLAGLERDAAFAVLFFLVTVLLTAAVGKFLGFQSFQARLIADGIRSYRLSALAAASIIAVEASCAGLLALDASSLIARALVTLLFASFLIVSSVDRWRDVSEPCQCFGSLLPSLRRGTATVIRNGLLLLLWLIVLLSESPKPAIGPWGLAGAVGCVGILILVGFVRPRRTRPPEPKVHPLPIGATLPSELRRLLSDAVVEDDGNEMAAGTESGRSPLAGLVVFSRSDCAICREAERVISAFHAHSEIVASLVVTDEETRWEGWRRAMVDNEAVTRLARSVGCAGVPCAIKVVGGQTVGSDVALGLKVDDGQAVASDVALGSGTIVDLVANHAAAAH